jgi:ABC-type Fe3+ transport system substrate-binding protein
MIVKRMAWLALGALIVNAQMTSAQTPAETAAKVAGGSAYACLTSLQDALQAKADGSPVAWAAPDQGESQMGAYVLYNTVCLAAVSTKPERGRQLADYLLSPEAEKYAAELGLGNVTLRDCGAGVPVVRPLETSLEESQKAMQEELKVILPYFTSANPKYTGK